MTTGATVPAAVGLALHGDHVVEFYESNDFLVRSVADYLAGGLLEGDAVAVVATPEHRRLFDRALIDSGVDVMAARAVGRYVELDAAETLSTFMVGALPDPARFHEAIGALIRQAATESRAVRVYGEMVALLWGDGMVNAAIALEDLWNDLGRLEHFSLFCAYPVTAFDDDPSGGPFRRICEQHSHVIPSEQYSALPESAAQLRQIAELPRQARQQARLVQALDELHRVNDLRSGLVSTLAHDVRSPLTVIRGALRCLLEAPQQPDPARQQELLQAADRHAARLEQLAEDLLNLARLEQGRMDLEHRSDH